MKALRSVILVAFVGVLAHGPTFATTTHDVGKQKKEIVHQPLKYEAPTLSVAFEPTMYSLTPAVVLETPKELNAPAVTSIAEQNSSKPLSIGLAIRQRHKAPIDVINLIVASTSGHRLLHIDPGLS